MVSDTPNFWNHISKYLQDIDLNLQKKFIFQIKLIYLPSYPPIINMQSKASTDEWPHLLEGPSNLKSLIWVYELWLVNETWLDD